MTTILFYVGVAFIPGIMMVGFMLLTGFRSEIRDHCRYVVSWLYIGFGFVRQAGAEHCLNLLGRVPLSVVIVVVWVLLNLFVMLVLPNLLSL